MYKIVMKRNAAEKWYWNLCSRNGNILATSQEYKRKPTAVCKKLAAKLGCEVEVA